jgi:type IV secretory pathway ATPase VirB11/archaellum biosynthesis ATPase
VLPIRCLIKRKGESESYASAIESIKTRHFTDGNLVDITTLGISQKGHGTHALPKAGQEIIMQTGGTHRNTGGVAGPPVSGKSSMSSQIVTSIPRNERLLHPLPLRITHWINAVAIFIMIGSGWKIYEDL